MTIGERNREIVRLTKDGFRSREIANKLGATEETIHQVMKRHRILGEEVFVSTKSWKPTKKEEKVETPKEEYQSRAEIDIITALGFANRMDLLKQNLKVGETVKFMRNSKIIKGEVAEKSTHTVLVYEDVHGHLVPHAPMYKDLVGMNQ